jgi:hypothetical protein
MMRDHRLLSTQSLAAVGGSAAVALAMWLAPVHVAARGQAAAAKYSVPHTPWGDPDFQGVWSNWDRTPFQTPNPDKAFAAAEAEAAQEGYGAEGRGDGAGGGMASIHNSPISARRKAQVVDPEDGRVPVQMDKREFRNVRSLGDTWETHGPHSRCITTGAPGNLLLSGAGGYSKGYRIIQSPGYVIIHMERFHEGRIIRIGGQHVGKNIKLWNGDSIGHWEGDTLVVDTTNFNNEGEGRAGVPQTETLHTIERFTRIDQKSIKYEVTHEDPAVYTRPWTAMQIQNFDPTYMIYEFACHEGNYRYMTGALKQGRLRDAEGPAVTAPAAAAPTVAAPAASVYDVAKPITLQGTLRIWQLGAPHVYLVVDVKDASGKVAQWTVEGHSTVQLIDAGWDVGSRGNLKAGNPITVTAYLPKPDAALDPIAPTLRLYDTLKVGKRAYGTEVTFAGEGFYGAQVDNTKKWTFGSAR